MSDLFQQIKISTTQSVNFLSNVSVQLFDHAHGQKIMYGNSFDLAKDDTYEYGCALAQITSTQRMALHYLEGLYNLGEINNDDVSFSMTPSNKRFECKINMGVSLDPFFVDNVITNTFKNLHFTYNALPNAQYNMQQLYQQHRPYFQAVVSLTDKAVKKIDDDALYLQEHASILSTVMDLHDIGEKYANKISMGYMIQAGKDIFENYYRHNDIREVIPYFDFQENGQLSGIIEWASGLYEPDAPSFGYSTYS